MRIGIISETWPPEINGVALTVHGLAVGLAARGHGIDLVRPRQPQPGAGADGMDEMLTRGFALPHYPGVRLGLPATRALRHRWERQRPDVVYIATEGPLGGSALRVARRLGIPAATGFHTRFDHYAGHYGLGWATPLVRAYLRRFHRRAAATLVPTAALGAELATLGVDNVRLLRRAVDTRLFHPDRRDPVLRARWGAGEDTPVVLYLGRIAAEKNLALAVRAFEALRQEAPAARFVWVGDGPERAALQAAHPDYVFTGMQVGEALARHVASADLFPFPSLSETFGNVVLEALAAGVALVAFDTGAAHEHLRDGVGGARIAPGDADAFVRATVRLGANPARLRRMRRAARGSMAQLSPDAVVREFETLLHELAGEPDHAHHVLAARA
ncbi:glycosyltransferase family 1 protein [Fulvimonas sp. R45]|uniref:glycosyltransferase family 4 protein n=1 Tax=Fulvimonas sp. R45 TaxID=3045937 RepID=UPI00265DEA38|nr:glycosyltransferase family 1 protein [Fulvimonas sp. R45]MDO1528608.1 glycosyltransferase family 1 protein [Fulvimonas sp. R45]